MASGTCKKHTADVICVLRAARALPEPTYCKAMSVQSVWRWCAVCRQAAGNSENRSIIFFRQVNFSSFEAGLGPLHKLLSMKTRLSRSKATWVWTTLHLWFFEVHSLCLRLVRVFTANLSFTPLFLLAPTTYCLFKLRLTSFLLLFNSSEISFVSSLFHDLLHCFPSQK